MNEQSQEKEDRNDQKQNPSDRARDQGFARFFTDAFLLNRGLFIFQTLIKRSTSYALTTAAQLFVFGGGLGLIWVLSHLEPRGDLAQYLLPITILAMPVAVISQRSSWTDRVLNILFSLSFLGSFVWSCWWYFEYPDWGYKAKWIVIEGLALTCLLYFTYRRGKVGPKQGPQQTLIYRFWVAGVMISLGALGFLSYYIGSQTAPEPGTSNILSGSAFVLFLAILIIRVYWLDGFRARRANQAEFTAPPDHIILFEWLVPRSFNFTIALSMLMIAQSMLFSTIYRAAQHRDRQHQQKRLEGSHPKEIVDPLTKNSEFFESIDPTLLVKWSESTTSSMTTPPLVSATERSSEIVIPSPVQQIRPDVSLGSWIFFSFKPYVFPKDSLGREVDAPKWFKYLGRALLGLVIAILLTKQLNIWKQIMGCYWILLGAARSEKHRGIDPKLTRQQDEMVDQLTGIFNHYNFMWRWLLLYAVTAPTLSLRWRLILDPASAYYLGLERMNDWVTEHWDAAISLVAGLIILITLPFCYQQPDHLIPFITAFAPTASSALFIYILRAFVGLKPPSSYQWWIWWLLICHLILSILNFFLAINVGSEQTFWSRVLWYAQLGTIVGYPALYLLGGERYKRIHNPNRRLTIGEDDCDVQVRRRLLVAFSDTEHRQWFFGHLTQRVHPVRSSRLQLRLISPSLLLNLLETLRNFMATTRELLTPLLGSYLSALKAWPLFIFISWSVTLLVHLFMNHRFLPAEYLIAYGTDLGVLIAPSIALLFVEVALGRRPRSSRETGVFFVRIFCMMMFIMASFWLWSEAPNLYQRLSSPLRETRQYSDWLIWTVCPLVSIWHLFWSRRTSKRGSDDVLEEETEKANSAGSIFRRIEHLLQNAEQHLISSVYQKTHRGRSFEVHYQSTMILNLAELVENSYRRLRNGELFHEERHALSRVQGDLLGREHGSSSERFEVIEELCTLLESTYDVLGSMLHDLTLTNLLSDSPNQEDHDRESGLVPSPPLELVIEVLSRIATYPLPRRGSSCVDPLSSGAIERLYTCHSEVIALTEQLVYLSYPEVSTKSNVGVKAFHLQTELSREDRLKLLRLWCLLESQLDDQSVYASTEHLEEEVALSPAFTFAESLLMKSLNDDPWMDHEGLSLLLSAAQIHGCGLRFIEALIRSTDHHGLPIDRLKELRAVQLLPTPLARLVLSLRDSIQDFDHAEVTWRERQQARQEARNSTGVRQQINPLSRDLEGTQEDQLTFLKSIQSPYLLSLIQDELDASVRLEGANKSRYEALSTLYFGSFAHLICSLKDLDHHLVLQSLSWQSADSLELSISALSAHKDELINPIAHDLVEVILELFKVDQAHYVEQACRDRSSWDDLIIIAQTITLELADATLLEAIPHISWTLKSDLQRGEASVLKLCGPSPRFEPVIHLESSISEYGAHGEEIAKDKGLLKLGRGVRLKGTALAPQVDYYTALWLLNQLYSLVHSDGVFQSKTASGLSENIKQLYALLLRLGKLMKPFSGEEQVVIERIFDLTFRRLKALKMMGQESLEILEGKGNIEFQDTLGRVDQYIQGVEARRERELHLQALLSISPNLDFSYLLNVELHEGEELRTYLTLDGSPEVIFKEEVSI